MYKITRLTPSLTLATAHMPQMSSVSVGVWVGIGSRYEPAQLNGVCHFLEHLLFKGTKRRTAKQISEAVEGIGGYLNAFTAEENTCFHARAGYDRFGELLDVLLDMFLNSRLDTEDIDKEREVINEEMAMYLDEPQHQVQELLNATLWPDQPLGRPITGTPQSLAAMKRKELTGYLRGPYAASGVLITVAGKLRHEQALRAVRRHALFFECSEKVRLIPADDRQSEPRIRLFNKKTEQTQIALGIRTCSRHDERRFALRLLNVLLGENMSSRLFQVIREDHGLAYSIYSTPSFFADTGDVVISAGLETDKLPKVLKLILGELKRFANAAASARELERARDYVIGQMELSLEGTENQMNWLGEQWLGYGRIFQPSEIKRLLCAVTAGEIRAVANEFFRPERLNLALVSPLKNERGLGRILSGS